MKSIQRFHDGLVAPIRGMQIIRGSRRLQMAALLPFVIAAFIMLFALPQAWHYLPLAVNMSLISMGMAKGLYFNILYFILNCLLWPVFVLIWFYVLFILVKLLGSPFHSWLAEHVLIDQQLIVERKTNLIAQIRALFRLVAVGFIELVAFSVLGLFLVLGSLIPGLNILTGFGFFLILAFACVDYSFDALQLGFRERVGFFARHWGAFSGFAISVGFIFMIPVLNVFLIPCAVAGAADLLRRLRIGDMQPLEKRH